MNESLSSILCAEADQINAVEATNPSDSVLNTIHIRHNRAICTGRSCIRRLFLMMIYVLPLLVFVLSGSSVASPLPDTDNTASNDQNVRRVVYWMVYGHFPDETSNSGRPNADDDSYTAPVFNEAVVPHRSNSTPPASTNIPTRPPHVSNTSEEHDDWYESAAEALNGVAVLGGDLARSVSSGVDKVLDAINLIEISHQYLAGCDRTREAMRRYSTGRETPEDIVYLENHPSPSLDACRAAREMVGPGLSLTNPSFPIQAALAINDMDMKVDELCSRVEQMKRQNGDINR